MIEIHRYYDVITFLRTNKPLHGPDQVGHNIKVAVETQIDNAYELAKEMVEEEGGVIEGVDVDVKPFGVGELAMAMIEVSVYVRR